ncbi:MAG: HlyD family secretion protein, partial [Acidobacteriota bacterium]
MLRSSLNSFRTLTLLAALLGAGVLPHTAGCRGERDGAVIRASGHVEATEVRISAKIGGTLEWLPMEEGDWVELGQEIARIDTVDLMLVLEAARAERDLAAADLRLRRAGYRQEEIAEATASVASAEAELEAAERDLQRFQGLLDTGSGTEKSRDDALTRRDLAARNLEASRERLHKLRAGYRKEEVEGAAARVAAAEARIAQIEQQIRDATVASPVAGVVTEKLVEQGELLPPGTALVVVTDLADAWLTAYLGERDLGRIRLGQAVEVVTDDGQTRQGRLTFIDARAEFTPKNVQTRDERVKLVYRIKISLDNADGLFKPGMPAEAVLVPQGPAGSGDPGSPRAAEAESAAVARGLP